MPEIYVETLAEYTAKHGGKNQHIDIQVDGLRGTTFRRLFSDGAIANFDTNDNLIGTQEPPTDKFDRVRAERTYLTEKLDRETTDWRRFRDEVGHQVSNAARYLTLPAVPDESLDQLEAGLARIGDLKRQIEACDEILLTTPEAIAQREQAERERLEIQRRHQQLQRFMSLAENGLVKKTPAEVEADLDKLDAKWLPGAKQR